MYTIPSLPGSSGSPVVNEYGACLRDICHALEHRSVLLWQAYRYAKWSDKRI